jgi:hypothetical protein
MVVEPVERTPQAPLVLPEAVPVSAGFDNPPSFHNPVALRVGLFVAMIATFLCLAVPYGFAIWLPSAGFISVYLFSRRTGQPLTVRGGARMGWIAGILSFVIIAVLFTVSVVALANQPGGIPAYFREHLNASTIQGQDMQKALEMLANPVDQALVYFFFLLFWFTVIAVFCTAGGALGAKVLDKS